MSARDLIEAVIASETAELQTRELLLQHRAHVVFKHSPYCGLSFMAHAEVTRYAASHGALPVTLIDVLSQRRLSQCLAETTAVRHESPQVLLVRDGIVEWHASHRGVTAEALTLAIQQQLSPPPPAPSA